MPWKLSNDNRSLSPETMSSTLAAMANASTSSSSQYLGPQDLGLGLSCYFSILRAHRHAREWPSIQCLSRPGEAPSSRRPPS